MVKSRKAAKKAGDKYYNTGKACKHGHYSKRLTSNCHCVECDEARTKVVQELIAKRWDLGVFSNYF